MVPRNEILDSILASRAAGEPECHVMPNPVLVDRQAAVSELGQPADKVFKRLLVDFELVEWLGKSHDGHVFKARHRGTQRYVTIRRLDAAWWTDVIAGDRFQNQFAATRKLAHANIEQLLEYVDVDGVYYLVTEYLAGRDVLSLVREGGPMSLDQALSCIYETAHGLAFAHGQGVAHGNIQPDRLFIDQKGTIKILNFGWERARKENIVGSDIRPEKSTPEFAALVSQDIQALGGTFFYLLTGKPFDRKVAASLPGFWECETSGIKKIFRRMTDSDPDQHYTRVSELLADLDHASKEATVKAQSTSAARPNRIPDVCVDIIDRDRFMTPEEANTALEVTVNTSGSYLGKESYAEQPAKGRRTAAHHAQRQLPYSAEAEGRANWQYILALSILFAGLAALVYFRAFSRH